MSTPITPDAPLCQALSCLPEKFVVDFANGIDVAREHVRVQRQRSAFFDRLYDGLTGQGTRRQAEINASLSDGLQASLQWLGELSHSLARSNWAIAQVNERVTALSGHVAQLAHYSADTREQLHALAQQLGERMQAMAREVARIDMTQQAKLGMDAAFSKWAAGRFAPLSPAGRCYATLEELRWGALGDYLRQCASPREHERLRQLVADKAVQHLAQDAGVRPHEAQHTLGVWLATPPARSAQAAQEAGDLQQALAYLADGTDAQGAPFVHSALQQRPAALVVPLIADARRLAEAMVDEVFPEKIAA
ncbi:hypothetical protein CK623_09575 [Vandammella animalimorsus]|uniref:Chemotaxis protein n=2 Tax=Vandammella animalimorsus TaxID=2029117 RepID=A0A2A2APD4_9BURK|nr:hypothetical protein CK623_09575 [Vandammella animalimorsus]